MKKISVSLLTIVMLFASCTPKSVDIHKMGISLMLTGYASFTGELLKQGVDMATDSLDFSAYTITVEDNQVNAKTAISVYNNFVAKGYS